MSSNFDRDLAQKELLTLLDYRMPYGKYTGTRLIDLPEAYVIWIYNKGLPKGELGKMLGIVYEIKTNGLEALLQPLIKVNHRYNE